MGVILAEGGVGQFLNHGKSGSPAPGEILAIWGDCRCASLGGWIMGFGLAELGAGKSEITEFPGYPVPRGIWGMMGTHSRHIERHATDRIGWLRASVLGANDGIVSTASLVIGVAAAHTGHASIMVAGIAGLVAGAMSMAAGEYVSVYSQADTEQADLAREKAERVTTGTTSLGAGGHLCNSRVGAGAGGPGGGTVDEA